MTAEKGKFVDRRGTQQCPARRCRAAASDHTRDRKKHRPTTGRCGLIGQIWGTHRRPLSLGAALAPCWRRAGAGGALLVPVVVPAVATGTVRSGRLGRLGRGREPLADCGRSIGRHKGRSNGPQVHSPKKKNRRLPLPMRWLPTREPPLSLIHCTHALYILYRHTETLAPKPAPHTHTHTRAHTRATHRPPHTHSFAHSHHTYDTDLCPAPAPARPALM